jgi:hypothetical protein
VILAAAPTAAGEKLADVEALGRLGLGRPGADRLAKGRSSLGHRCATGLLALEVAQLSLTGGHLQPPLGAARRGVGGVERLELALRDGETGHKRLICAQRGPELADQRDQRIGEPEDGAAIVGDYAGDARRQHGFEGVELVGGLVGLSGFAHR